MFFLDHLSIYPLILENFKYLHTLYNRIFYTIKVRGNNSNNKELDRKTSNKSN